MFQVIGEVQSAMSQFGATAKNPPWVRTTGKFGKVFSHQGHDVRYIV
jgi:hypothetical protein